MSKYVLIFILLFSSASYADINGIWKGKLNINGKACKPTSIEITKTPDSFSIFAALDDKGNHAFECGIGTGHSYYMWLEDFFIVQGTELWRFGDIMGTITDKAITAKDRFCDEKGCKDYDYIDIEILSENKIKISIDFAGAILTGELTQ